MALYRVTVHHRAAEGGGRHIISSLDIPNITVYTSQIDGGGFVHAHGDGSFDYIPSSAILLIEFTPI